MKECIYEYYKYVCRNKRKNASLHMELRCIIVTLQRKGGSNNQFHSN